MNQTLTTFFDALNEQEARFLSIFASDNLGLLLRAAINELDWYAYNHRKSKQTTYEQQEQFYLMQLGVPRLAQLILQNRPTFDIPTVLFRRESSITIPVLQIVSGLGMIQHGRRVAQSVRAGLADITQTAKRDFVITLPESLPDDTAYERSVGEHYRIAAERTFSNILDSAFGRKMRSDVDKLLIDLVYPFREHFIGYDAHPTLDAYFFGLAGHHLQQMDGHDSFNYASDFGGIPFQNYMLALTFLVSMTMCHERFAETLTKKYPTIQLENVLTISAETLPFIKSIQEAVNWFGEQCDSFRNISLEEARAIFAVLSVHRNNLALLDRPGCPLPLLIQCSDHDVIRCQTGSLSEPTRFLLESLRYHFPREYDQNQRAREKAMQSAIKRELDDVFSDLEYRENIAIRRDNNQLTDIDLVVVEPSSGTMLLMQLKHQDIYGLDLNAQHQRTTRLKQQVARWLRLTKSWLNDENTRNVQSVFRLQKSKPVNQIYRIIVTRHYSYPIRDIPRDDDVAYANWNMFFNAVQLSKQSREKPNLATLARILRHQQEPSGRIQYYPEPRSEWIIDDLKFTTLQERHS